MSCRRPDPSRIQGGCSRAFKPPVEACSEPAAGPVGVNAGTGHCVAASGDRRDAWEPAGLPQRTLTSLAAQREPLRWLWSARRTRSVWLASSARCTAGSWRFEHRHQPGVAALPAMLSLCRGSAMTTNSRGTRWQRHWPSSTRTPERQRAAVSANTWMPRANLWASRAGNWRRGLPDSVPTLIPQPGSLIRRSAWEHVGGLDERLHYAMDLDLFLRLRRFGVIVRPHRRWQGSVGIRTRPR